MTSGTIHASLDLLDRQILDRDGQPVGKVDDVELSDPREGPPRVVAFLLGPQAYGERLGGRIGAWIAAVGSRLAGTDRPIRIPVALVDEMGVSIKLRVPVEEIERVERFEDWLREHVVGRIPGAGSASE